MEDFKDKIKEYVDPKSIATGIIVALIVGASIYALGRMGKTGKTLATIAKGGR